jgi:hypothetical protein
MPLLKLMTSLSRAEYRPIRERLAWALALPRTAERGTPLAAIEAQPASAVLSTTIHITRIFDYPPKDPSVLVNK